MPITLIPLDATNTAPLTQRFYAELGADRTTPIAEFIYEVLTREKASIENDGWSFWAPLAAAAITHPDVVDTQTMPISIVTASGREHGRTKRDDAGRPIQVAT